MSANHVSELSEQTNIPLSEIKDQKKLTTIPHDPSPKIISEISPNIIPEKLEVKILEEIEIKIPEKPPHREKSPSPKPQLQQEIIQLDLSRDPSPEVITKSPSPDMAKLKKMKTVKEISNENEGSFVEMDSAEPYPSIRDVQPKKEEQHLKKLKEPIKPKEEHHLKKLKDPDPIDLDDYLLGDAPKAQEKRLNVPPLNFNKKEEVEARATASIRDKKKVTFGHSETV